MQCHAIVLDTTVQFPEDNMNRTTRPGFRLREGVGNLLAGRRQSLVGYYKAKHSNTLAGARQKGNT